MQFNTRHSQDFFGDSEKEIVVLILTFYEMACVNISDVHNIRNHKGQGSVARRLRSLLHSETYPSEIARKSSEN